MKSGLCGRRSRRHGYMKKAKSSGLAFKTNKPQVSFSFRRFVVRSSVHLWMNYARLDYLHAGIKSAPPPDQKDSRDLLSILDREPHLITPIDRLDGESTASDSLVSKVESHGFQLTHDFLIEPIRQWIEFHIRRSLDGKAKLRLEEFSEL
jgi:hypothetical protein